MQEFNSINEILDFAIQNEQNAVDFYNDLAKTAHSDDMKQIFMQFAREEMGHKAKLLKIKEEGIMSISAEKVLNLKISDYVVRSEASENMTYEQALVLAMKREKAAFRLYTKMAEKTDNQELRAIFESLALEESRHKLRFEIEYDEYVLREN
ncbi:MAG TPA: ferritin family protein [Bacteroidia bacterium]|nr:ferritin family protein [Bacteroidia bacterium]HRS59635.1 ferritin family protein [Bacteroidia bacterium]HRU68990.1 ferritin family protein [Bacteroidia bacterium]